MDIPDLETELALHQQGYRFIAGLDEVGRGAWAGPVVAAAVILPLTCPHTVHLLAGVRDSKQVPPAKRELLYDVICRSASDLGIGYAGPEEVDRVGVVPATRLAMARAIAHLALAPDYLVIDHLQLPDVEIPQLSEKKADCTHLSVASASIIAKVFRDRLMVKYSERYPQFNFAAHKGYGTLQHQMELANFGPSPIHRRSFAPLRALDNGETD